MLICLIRNIRVQKKHNYFGNFNLKNYNYVHLCFYVPMC